MKNARKIAPVVRIQKYQDIDEREELKKYREGCLRLTPDERVQEMRRLSRRIRLLNPRNPRSHRIKPIVKIMHDAL